MRGPSQSNGGEWEGAEIGDGGSFARHGIKPDDTPGGAFGRYGLNDPLDSEGGGAFARHGIKPDDTPGGAFGRYGLNDPLDSEGGGSFARHGLGTPGGAGDGGAGVGRSHSQIEDIGGAASGPGVRRGGREFHCIVWESPGGAMTQPGPIDDEQSRAFAEAFLARHPRESVAMEGASFNFGAYGGNLFTTSQEMYMFFLRPSGKVFSPTPFVDRGIESFRWVGDADRMEEHCREIRQALQEIVDRHPTSSVKNFTFQHGPAGLPGRVRNVRRTKMNVLFEEQGVQQQERKVHVVPIVGPAGTATQARPVEDANIEATLNTYLRRFPDQRFTHIARYYNYDQLPGSNVTAGQSIYVLISEYDPDWRSKNVLDRGVTIRTIVGNQDDIAEVAERSLNSWLRSPQMRDIQIKKQVLQVAAYNYNAKPFARYMLDFLWERVPPSAIDPDRRFECHRWVDLDLSPKSLAATARLLERAWDDWRSRNPGTIEVNLIKANFGRDYIYRGRPGQSAMSRVDFVALLDTY